MSFGKEFFSLMNFHHLVIKQRIHCNLYKGFLWKKMHQSCQISRIFLLNLPSYLHHQKFTAVQSDASFLLPTSLFSCFPYLSIHKLSLLLTIEAPSFSPSSVSSSFSFHRAIHSFNSSSLQLEMWFYVISSLQAIWGFSYLVLTSSTTKILLLPFMMFHMMSFFLLFLFFFSLCKF